MSDPVLVYATTHSAQNFSWCGGREHDAVTVAGDNLFVACKGGALVWGPPG